jgi:hypothetical protein
VSIWKKLFVSSHYVNDEWNLRLCRTANSKIIVKFLPSINISYGVDEATSNFQLFSELRKKYPEIVCGIDLSGNDEIGTK